MAIDPTKVLVIINTNSALVVTSRGNADYYANARGLGSPYYNLMGFDFGPTVNQMLCFDGIDNFVGPSFSSSPPTVVTTGPGGYTSLYSSLPFIQAIAKFIKDHAIQAVLVECNVPPFVSPNQGDSYVYNVPIESYIGNAPYYSAGVPVAPNQPIPYLYANYPHAVATPVPTRVLPKYGAGTTRYLDATSDTSGSTRIGNAVGGLYTPGYTSGYFKVNSLSIPSGKIGYPGASSSEVRRCVDDAVWAETQDNRNKLHVLGGSIYKEQTRESPTIHSLYASNGFTSMGHFTGSAPDYPEYTGLAVNQENFQNAANNPVLFFAMVYSNGPQNIMYNVPPGTYPDFHGNTFTITTAQNLYLNTQVLRGGWGYNWQSSAYLFGTTILLKGGCAAVMNSHCEPYIGGIPGMAEFAAGIFYGQSMCEALFNNYDMQNLTTTVCGDPLYRPYAKTVIVATEFKPLS